MSFFGELFKDEALENFDARIDTLVNQFPSINREEPVDLLSGDFISSFMEHSSKDELEKVLQGISVSRDRLERYAVYDEAYKYVPILKRMMKVYVANILQKNPVTGKSILIQESGDLTSEKRQNKEVLDQAKDFSNNCIKTFGLLDRLKHKILPNELTYGDCYLEVVDVNQEIKKSDPEGAAAVQMTTLFEGEYLNMSKEVEQMKNRANGHLPLGQIDQLLMKTANYLAEIEIASFPESYDPNEKDDEDKKRDVNNYSNSGEGNEKENKKKSETIDFNDIVLKLHKPQQIIVLQTNYGSTIGYLEVTKDEFPQVFNLTQSLSTLVGRITSLIGKDQLNQDNVTDRIVRFIVKQALDKADKAKAFNMDDQQNAQSINDILKNLDPNVYTYIKRLIIEQGLNQTQSQYLHKLKIRFISASRMIAFTIPSNEYDPYGISFIDNLVFQCKLYILSQLSNVIMKLSRAAPVRKWTIDTGSTQMHANLIQKLKRELYNTRVTLDDLGSFKSIPKLLSDFKDMFVLAKGGNKPIDVEVTSHGDPTIRVADLEDARREIMSLSGIPPAYLGYADVIELREQLVHTNVSFATEIIDMQENITAGLTKFVDIVAEILKVNYKPSEYVQIKLIPPIVLILQLIEMTLSSIGNINGIFQTLQTPVDPYFFLKQYVPYIDWEAFKEAADVYTTAQKTKAEIDANKGGGGDPGAGGG